MDVYRNDFEAKMLEMYPDTASSGTVTRQEILDVMAAMNSKRYPSWMMKNRVGRGLYAINGGAAIAEQTPAVESVKVDYTDTKSLIPSVDSNYVPFGNYRDLDNIIKSGIFYPAFISGPTGNGKSTMIEQICAKRKRPLIRINFNKMTDEDQLIGTKTLTDGNVEIVEGPLLIAMRTGTTILLDEIDAGNANTIMCLQPILEGKPYYFKLKNEIIYPKDGFNIIATANTKGKGSEDGRYIGTNVLNEAFLERFAVTFNQEYPPARVEMKIVTNVMESLDCLNNTFADTLVKWAGAIRKTFEDGGVDELITTRRLIHIVRAYAIFEKELKAVELCTNRFDDATKSAFIDLFTKINEGDYLTEDDSVETVIETDGVPF